MLLRGLVAAVACCADVLMGASLPAIVRWVEPTPSGVDWWGCSMEATLSAQSSAACSRDFGCCEFMTPRSRPMRQQRSTWLWPRSASGWPRRTPARAGLESSEPTPEQTTASNVPVYIDHRALGSVRARRGGRVDPPAGHAARRNRLCLLDHSGGLSDRPRTGQRRRGFAAAEVAAAHSARMVPVAADRRHRVDRLHDGRFPSLLAH